MGALFCLVVDWIILFGVVWDERIIMIDEGVGVADSCWIRSVIVRIGCGGVWLVRRYVVLD